VNDSSVPAALHRCRFASRRATAAATFETTVLAASFQCPCHTDPSSSILLELPYTHLGPPHLFVTMVPSPIRKEMAPAPLWTFIKTAVVVSQRLLSCPAPPCTTYRNMSRKAARERADGWRRRSGDGTRRTAVMSTVPTSGQVARAVSGETYFGDDMLVPQGWDQVAKLPLSIPQHNDV